MKGLRSLRRAHRRLEEEVDGTDGLMNLIDNFEVLADSLLRASTSKKPKRSYSLDETLRKLAKDKHKDKSLLKRRRATRKDPWWKLADNVEKIVDAIRDAEYGGWDEDEDELVAKADEIRQSVFDAVDKILQGLASRTA